MKGLCNHFDSDTVFTSFDSYLNLSFMSFIEVCEEGKISQLMTYRSLKASKYILLNVRLTFKPRLHCVQIKVMVFINNNELMLLIN